ncbi:MAG: hypothetical protein C0404_06005 [Verrucomicrobia bacterium]|nr:hypothetical protein [Verrucomicrobiota bacterium]
MDIEKKAEIAGRVLIWVSAPFIIILDTLAGMGMLWIWPLVFVLPVLAVLHIAALFRKRRDV